MAANLKNAAAIVGAAESNEIGYPEERGPKVTSLQHHIEAIKNVSNQTGIPISDIQGVFSAGWSSQLAEHLGLRPRYIDTTSVGGCSFQILVHHALAAIHAGIIDVALVSHGQAGWSYRGAGGGGGRAVAGEIDPATEMTMSYGVFGAPSNYAHAMVRHMHRFGTTPEDFAHVSVVTRQWATLNPRALMFSKDTNPYGGPITVADVMNARLIAWPLTLLHCCLVTDHGGRRHRCAARNRPQSAHQPRVGLRGGRVHGSCQHAGNGGLYRHLRIAVIRHRLRNGGPRTRRYGNGDDL